MDAHVVTYTNDDRTALARLLDRNGVRLTKVGTPVTTTNGNNSQLGDDDGGADGGGHFLGGLDTETNVTLAVTDDNDGFEAGTLTGTGLLLDWLDLYHHAMLASAPNLHIAPENPLKVLQLSVFQRTFMTSSLSLGRKKSTIWYSLIGREWR